MSKRYWRRPVKKYRWSADVDDVVVRRAISGEHPGEMTVGERKQAVLILTARGMCAWRIAEMLKLSRRTVIRYRRDGYPACVQQQDGHDG